MTGRHENSPPRDPVMRVTDDVGSGVSRRRALVLVAAGILLFGIAAGLLFIGLNGRVEVNSDQNRLSRSEIQDIKDLLAARRTQRDDEHDQVQAQLDAQARVLCAVIEDFRDRAGPRTRVTLDRAKTRLHCADLSTAVPAGSSTSSPAPTGSTPPPAGPTTGSRPSTSSSRPPVIAGPTPTPSPTPTGLLGGALCGLLRPVC